MIRKILSGVPIFLFSISAFAQDDYFQQRVDYTIQARLNTNKKAIHGHVAFTYYNASPDTLNYIWFHLWPNAYSGDNTALAGQVSKDSELKKSSKKAEKGFMDSLNFSSGKKPLKTSPHPQHPDIIKVELSEPLMPGKSVDIETPFYNKLPTYYSRSGESEGQFIATQWYPKPAVYDKDGWHEMPYLDMGEYYAEFGKFDVSITVPANMMIAATGQMQDTDELALYKEAGTTLQKTADGNPPSFATSAGNKTLRFTADNVHDFAWFAMPGFLVQYDTCQLASGRVIDVFSYYRPDAKTHWIKSIDYLKSGIRFYSNALGEYPHPQVSAVQGPRNVNSGGMEYPMITLITVPQKEIETQLEPTIVHEVGHNWFQGILGTNERKYPWFDEGINTFYQFQYEAQSGKNSILGKNIPDYVRKMPADQFFNVIMQAMANIPFSYAVNTSSEDFSSKQDYGITAYIKAAIWVYILQSRMGVDAFNEGMRQYFDQWKFRHPTPADFQASMEKAAGYKLDDIFSLLDKQGSLTNKE
jgi:hypothetical protein